MEIGRERGREGGKERQDMIAPPICSRAARQERSVELKSLVHCINDTSLVMLQYSMQYDLLSCALSGSVPSRCDKRRQ